MWVQRTAGVITGVFANQQPGLADEELADGHADVLAFFADQVPGSTAQLPKERAAAKAMLQGAHDPNVKLVRAVVLTLLDEVNLLRSWLVDFKAQTAAATNLADFKARVATLPATPDRTAAQAKNAVANKLDGGGGD